MSSKQGVIDTTLDFKRHFEALADFFFGELLPNEHASVSYDAEDTYFLRMNHAKVRQNGFVQQAALSVTLYKNKRTYSFAQGLTGLLEQDKETVAESLEDARKVIAQLPEDPYQSIPTSSDRSETIYDGALIPQQMIEKNLLDPANGLDFAGLFAQGMICRGAANTAGARHWFQTKTFTLDYSIWSKVCMQDVIGCRPNTNSVLPMHGSVYRYLHLSRKKLSPANTVFLFLLMHW